MRPAMFERDQEFVPDGMTHVAINPSRIVAVYDQDGSVVVEAADCKDAVVYVRGPLDAVVAEWRAALVGGMSVEPRGGAS